ncbi:EFR1 family ferrodoxin, partial [Ruminococcus sp.]|uniref:EFR1 family ferrodoxin n=1 Tax=Ruminococcus sp. TaxID=41978 RepID=UPI002E771B1E
RRTSNFYVEDSCIGCGLCAKQCPVQAIEIQNGKPIWIKEHCTLCLRCLHLCPKFSIQYGDGKTKQHGQYHHP